MSKYDNITGKVELQNDASGLAVNLNDAKAFLKLDDVSSEEDALLTALIKGATSFVEDYTGRLLLTQTVKLYLDRFPSADLKIPHSPVSTISSVSYQDTVDATQTLATSIYALDSKSLIPTMSLKYSQCYPDTYAEKNVVTITYTAGYGSQSDIPETIRHCIKLVAGHFYERRNISFSNGLPHIRSAAFGQILSILLKPYIVRL